jgi:hypothetical protein
MRNFSLWKLLLLAILFLGIAYVGCISTPNETPLPNESKPSEVAIEKTLVNTTGFDLNKYPELKQRLEGYGAVKESKRPDYLPAEVFKFLPKFPRDFYWVKTMVELGLLTDVNAIPAEYYKQPEFYPRFDTIGVDMMQHPTPGRFGAWGFGTYPSEVLLNAKVNETTGVETTAYTIFHTSWLVETYQGMGLTVVYPNEAHMLSNQFSDGSRSVTQNSSEVAKYFETEFVSLEPKCSRGTYVNGKCEWDSPAGAECYAIYNETTKKCVFTPASSPDVLLLEPAFPVFQYGWAQKVGLKIKVKPGTPKGKYVIGMGVSSPPKEISDKWLMEYKLVYAGSGMFGLDVPWFQVFVEVK